MRKLLTIAAFAATTVPALFAVGCATGTRGEPYSLTGRSQEQVDREHQEWRQRMQYTDDKGRYHPELAAQHQPLRPIPPQ